MSAIYCERCFRRGLAFAQSGRVTDHERKLLTKPATARVFVVGMSVQFLCDGCMEDYRQAKTEFAYAAIDAGEDRK